MVEEKDRSRGILRKISRVLQEVEESKSERDVKKGRREEALLQLERDHSIKSLVDSRKRIKALDEQITRRTKNIDVLFEDLEETYEF